jgi:glycopeptide antibiotics resistance protein
MLTHVLLVFVGWGMLLAMTIIYTMTGQKAFSGKGAGAKNVLFILAFVGYAIPVLNILPLFFFWTLAVLKNPR